MQVTKKLDGHLFITLNEKKIDPKQRSYCESEKGTMKNVWMWATPLQCTKVGEQLADYLPCGGFVVTDQGEKKYFIKMGFSVLKQEIFVMFKQYEEEKFK